jgi:predicted transposase YdaD
LYVKSKEGRKEGRREGRKEGRREGRNYFLILHVSWMPLH